MHSKRDNTETMINDEADEVIKRYLNHSKIDTNITCLRLCSFIAL